MPNMMEKQFDQLKYQNNYNKEKYYSPKLSLPKNLKPVLEQKGKEYGSITKYIISLINRDLEQPTDNQNKQLHSPAVDYVVFDDNGEPMFTIETAPKKEVN